MQACNGQAFFRLKLLVRSFSDIATPYTTQELRFTFDSARRKSFCALRLLLGAAEAGFAPGVYFFLSLWVPSAYRGRMIAGFLVAMPLASVMGLSFFVPQIVHQFGLSIVKTGFVAAIPFVVAAIGMMWWSRRSDLLGERRFHLVMPVALAVVGFVGSTLVDLPIIRLALLCVAAFGTFSALPIFWTLPTALLPTSAVAAGIAIANSIGNLSGFVDSYAVGAIKDATGSFAGGMQLIAGFGVLAVGLLLLITRNTAWARPVAALPKDPTQSFSKPAG